MTQQEKDLLFKDLCMRLPYGVYLYSDYDEKPILLESILPKGEDENGNTFYWINERLEVQDIKPYLRPLSSMTKEEKEIYKCFAIAYGDSRDIMIPNRNIIAWLLSKHFDFYGLIDRGLAIEVTDDNNPYKN